MKVTYSHLLSPIQIGSHTIRNRIIASNAPPHFICGAENAPEDAFLTYYGNLAKNGAGIVVVTDWSTNQKSSPALDVQRYPYYDISDPAVTNNLSLLAESVHYYRSKILISKLGSFPVAMTCVIVTHRQSRVPEPPAALFGPPLRRSWMPPFRSFWTSLRSIRPAVLTGYPCICLIRAFSAAAFFLR